VTADNRNSTYRRHLPSSLHNAAERPHTTLLRELDTLLQTFTVYTIISHVLFNGKPCYATILIHILQNYTYAMVWPCFCFLSYGTGGGIVNAVFLFFSSWSVSISLFLFVVVLVLSLDSGSNARVTKNCFSYPGTTPTMFFTASSPNLKTPVILKQRLTPEWPSRITASFLQPFVSGVVDNSRSVMPFLYTFSCNISHTPLSTRFKSGKVGIHN